MMKLLKELCYYKKYICLGAVFIVIIAAQLATALSDEAKHIESYKLWMTTDIENLIDVSISNKKQVTEILYKEFIDDDTSQKLWQVIDGDEGVKNKVRNEFLSRYAPLYDNIKKIGLRQFQFHLPNTENFLRLEKPNLYGDRLIADRQTINGAIKERQLVMGFEEGRVGSGYRYVYPILNKGQVVGTVELSFSYYSIVKPVISTYGVEGLFMMDRDEVDHKTFDWPKENYLRDDYFGLGYLDKDFKVETINQGLGIGFDDYLQLNKKIKSAILDQRYGVEGFSTLLVNQQMVWAVPLAVEDYTGKIVGCLIFYKNDPVLYELYAYQNRQRRNMYITSAMIILLIIPCIVFFLQVKTRAASDSLTNLFNRHYFKENIVQKGIKGSVMMIDIDDFKAVNDHYGHGAGDSILKEIANILKGNIRDSDVAVRWGGEEFLVVLKEADVKIALKKGEYLLELIRASRVEGIQVTVSIGVSLLDEDYDESVRRADEALYYVKSHGKNAVKIYESTL
jgi:diguanylate cyclase (GGDEF)-like protein